METQNENVMDKHIQERYKNAIEYYWGASRANKKWYKRTRSYTVILGALVTLIASLNSSTIIDKCIYSSNGECNIELQTLFSLGTPILAAVLTTIAGFSQSFQWGSTWQNMVLTAQQLQKEFDRYLVTPLNERNFSKEAEILNAFVINESRGFFDRMLGIARPSVDETINGQNGNQKHKDI